MTKLKKGDAPALPLCAAGRAFCVPPPDMVGRFFAGAGMAAPFLRERGVFRGAPLYKKMQKSSPISLKNPCEDVILYNEFVS